MNIKSYNTIVNTNNSFEAHNKKENFFTVKLVKSGLGDMLWQLSLLYRISQLSDYTSTYIHTPFAYEKRYKLTLFGKIFKKIENAVNDFLGIDKYSQKLSKFLGLDKLELNISDKKFANYQIIEIPIHKIFQEDKILDIYQLKNSFKKFIESVTPSSKPVIYCLTFTPELYAHRRAFQLEELLNGADPEEITLKSLKLKLSESYRKAREDRPVHIPFDAQTVKVVIHLRKGDRMLVNLSKKIIGIFSTNVKVFESKSDLDEWESNNYSNYNDTHKAYALVEKIFSRYGKENFSVIVISDGYERTYQNIKHAIFKGKITFSKEEKSQIEKLEKIANTEFDIFSNFSNVSTIIGESENNTFKSIHAIICADIIIKTTGGFAWVLHSLFKSQDRPSTIVKLGQDDHHTIEKIGVFLTDNISWLKNR